MAILLFVHLIQNHTSMTEIFLSSLSASGLSQVKRELAEEFTRHRMRETERSHILSLTTLSYLFRVICSPKRTAPDQLGGEPESEMRSLFRSRQQEETYHLEEER